MTKKVSIIINDVQYDRVKPKFDISCDECDLEFLCEDIESKMPWACMALSVMDDIRYIFKKSRKINLYFADSKIMLIFAVKKK